MSQPPSNDITLTLEHVNRGDNAARERLLSTLYEELRQLAAVQMKAERRDHTLQPTALVHEAYLRLIGNNQQAWQNRAHFFGAAAEVMRRILVDHARARGAEKRAGGRKRPLEELSNAAEMPGSDPLDLLVVDEALTELERVDPDKARIIKLRYFGGLTADQAAEALGQSVRTVQRQWRYARAWLFNKIRGSRSADAE